MSNDINKNDKNNIAFIGISNQNHSKNEISKMIEGKTLPWAHDNSCLLYTSPSPRDQRGSRMPACG